MTSTYLAVFIVGAVAVVSMFAFDVGHGDGLPFLSLTALAAAVLGAGAGGLISSWVGMGAVGSGVVALISASAMTTLLQGVVLTYLRRQQANSHRARSSYIGLLGTVTLEVPVGGWGEVSFVDAEGSRVRSRAKSTEPQPLPTETPVYIADVDEHYVHVVTVPTV